MVIRKFISAIVLVAMIFTVAMPTYADNIEDEKARLQDVQQQLQNFFLVKKVPSVKFYFHYERKNYTFSFTPL